MKRTFLSLVLLIIVFLTGCQQTPNAVNVIGKFTDFLEDVEEVPFIMYETPLRIDSIETIRGLELVFNAHVSVPEVDGYSVIEVDKEKFDKKVFQKVMDYFHPGQQWIEEPELTKREIIETINELTTSEDANEPFVLIYIEELKNRLGSAPDEISPEIFSLDKIASGNSFYAYNKNSETAEYSVLAGQLDGNTYQYRRDKDEYWKREEQAETRQELSNFASMEPSISLEKALAIAEKAKTDLNADPSMKLSYYTKSIGYKNNKPCSVGWEFSFMRDCNGLQAKYIGEWSTWKGSPPPSNASPWEYEFMFITVDEKGIVKYDTRGAGKEKRVRFSNIELLDFESIFERIKQQLVYNHVYKPDDMEEHYVTVFDIELSSALINAKDQSNVGRLIPAWVILYDFHEKYKGDNEYTVHHCHLYLNAIDGSYIEPRVDIAILSNIS